MASGKVKWFDNKKGFGFIAQNSGQDVFVHHTSIMGCGYKTLNEGDEVEFELVPSNRLLKAANVKRCAGAESVVDVVDVIDVIDVESPVQSVAGKSHKSVARKEEVTPIEESVEVGPPTFAVSWDPEAVDPTDYADLMEALGNFVRAKGGLGISLLKSCSFGVSMEKKS